MRLIIVLHANVNVVCLSDIESIKYRLRSLGVWR